MLRSRVARTNSKLEIFIGIVDCSHSQNLFYLICISHFWSASFPGKIILLFLSIALQPHAPTASERSCPLFPERLTFFMGFGFFLGFEVSNSDTWGQNMFSIYKTFARYFWLQNAH